MKAYYQKRLDEAQALLDELVERSQNAEGAEFQQLVEQVTAAQQEVNNWAEGLRRVSR